MAAPANLQEQSKNEPPKPAHLLVGRGDGPSDLNAGVLDVIHMRGKPVVETTHNENAETKAVAGKSPETHCERFDAALTKLTQNRSRDYGHPYDDFGTVAVLVNELKDVDDPRLFHIMYMICVKLSRLKTTPDHFDSWADIAGYARTACMVIDRAALTKEKIND